MKRFSLKKGFEQVQKKDIPKVRLEIMNVLGLSLNNRTSWSQYMRGDLEPKVNQALQIEEIFSDFGISDIWLDHESNGGTN